MGCLSIIQRLSDGSSLEDVHSNGFKPSDSQIFDFVSSKVFGHIHFSESNGTVIFSAKCHWVLNSQPGHCFFIRQVICLLKNQSAKDCVQFFVGRPKSSLKNEASSPTGSSKRSSF